jgi:hypothetical protein
VSESRPIEWALFGSPLRFNVWLAVFDREYAALRLCEPLPENVGRHARAASLLADAAVRAVDVDRGTP